MSSQEETTNPNDKDRSGPRGLREGLTELYYGENKVARNFRFGLIAFDVLTVLFFIVSSVIESGQVTVLVDYALAAVFALEYAARMIIANRPWRFTLRFTSLVDLVVIFSLLAPAFMDSLAFLRVARMLRLFRSYHVLTELRHASRWFRTNEDVIHSGINLFVFVFVLTAIVYVVEGHRNPEIGSFFDALYFTVTTLTTTGFGDIIMSDTAGRILAVIIMVFGVALFLRLVQTIFRPPKVHFTCKACGLSRHEPDAVHCKHCGEVLKIPTEGVWR